MISVIIPIYNAERFLERAIESVLKQSYDNWELILVDDKSNDKSVKICEEYSGKDNRIKILKMDENSGPAACRNYGMDKAAGEYIFFLDADDIIEPETFEILLNGFSSDIDLVMSNFKKLNPDGKIIKQSVTFGPGETAFEGEKQDLYKEDIINFTRHFLNYPSNHLISYCWARLYKTSIIREFNINANEKMKLFEDYTFNLEYLSHCNHVLFINKPLYTYVMHDSCASASMKIFNSASLIHDMQRFKEATLYNLENLSNGNLDSGLIKMEIGHALTHYAIIFFVRAARFLSFESYSLLRKEFKNLMNSEIYKESVRQYIPRKGYSKAIPILSGMKCVLFTILVCWYKANKRYGKLKKS